MKKLTALVNTVSGRLFLNSLVIHAILVPLLFTAVVYVLQQGYQSLFVNQVRSEAYMFSNFVAALAPNQMKRLEYIVDDALLGGHLVYVELDFHGKLVLRRDARLRHAVEFEEDFFFGQHGDEVYLLALPISDADDNPLGTLRLGYDERTTKEQIELARRHGIMIVTAYAALALLLAVVTALQVTRPLAHLRRLSRRITAGAVSTDLAIASPLVEVNDLAKDLDDMRKELVRQADHLEFHAHHDALTALPNRTLFRQHLQRVINSHGEVPSSAVLLVMDLNHFKEVNDTLGHPIGDTVLQLVAARLRSTLPDEIFLARLGGDEFAMVVENTPLEACFEIAASLQRAFETPLLFDNHSINIGASIGLAIWPEDGGDFETLLRRADVAMYISKRDGLPCSRYEKIRDPYSPDQLSLAGELRHGIARDELAVVYQPKINLATGTLVGVEALLRWNHPRRGALPPATFVPIAEKSGLIGPLTRWVLNRALAQYRDWLSNGADVHIAINISAKNVVDPEFIAEIMAAVERYDVPTSGLIFELTESALLSDPERAAATLKQLGEIGIRLAIDDFGTGYSSFSYLKQLPVREIKIDKMFIDKMDRDKKDRTIVKAMIDMAHNLELAVVAEGVEQRATADMLRELECDIGQGFFISPPLSADDLAAIWFPTAINSEKLAETTGTGA